MSFSSPLWLLFLLLVPLVIIIHALSIRWRSLPASSLVFWNEVLRERKASLRIRRLLTSLVLILQILAMTALAVALAGPLLAGLSRTGSHDVILVLDATASMQTREGTRTRFDIARERGLSLASGLHSGARMAVVLAEKSPRLLSAFSGDTTALRRVIQAARPTDEPGNVASSMLFAMSLRDPRRGGLVVLETDGAFEELRGVDTSLPWVQVDIVGDARENVGITQMSFRMASGADAGYQLFLAVRNAGRAPAVVPLAVRAGGRDVVSRSLSLEAGQRSTVTVPWTGPTSGTIEAVLQTGDALPLDDRAYAVFAPARRLQVLIVGPQPWFVRQALAALPGVTVRTQEVPTPQEGGAPPAAASAAPGAAAAPIAPGAAAAPIAPGAAAPPIAPGAAAPPIAPGAAAPPAAASPAAPPAAASPAAPAAASPAAPPADVAVYVGVQPPDLEKGNFIIFDAVPPNLPLRLTGSLSVPPVTGWSRTDPLLDSVSLAGVTIGQSLDLEPGPGFSVLAASGTSPLMLRWEHAGVKALIVAFDPRASDFPLRPGFPVLLANTLAWFYPTWLQVQADQMQAGDTRVLPTENPAGVTVVKPDGSRVNVASGGLSASFLDTAETGIYTVEAGGETSEFAVNLASDAETDISRRFSGPNPQAGGSAERRGMPTPVWPPIAAAALAVLLLEWLAWVWRPGRSATA